MPSVHAEMSPDAPGRSFPPQDCAALFDGALAALPPGTGLLGETTDPRTGDALGDLPPDPSHLAPIHAACSIAGDPPSGERRRLTDVAV